ncbi:hypothetical protein BB560_003650 [Smittium megazygosporum]|uniref:Obg family GTPase CgtA n=1 Tax=Smittium megazygosporum TaxID=133381 RepID=A0A2T9ZBE2_9FUNG|nr:hypothetical protein BB560_003650 [Smittium megazygosporum]
MLSILLNSARNASDNSSLKLVPFKEFFLKRIPCFLYSTDVKRNDLRWKLRAKGSNFVDHRRVIVSGGSGGNGCVSFLKDLRNPKGKPNGGNGGMGGKVYFVADENEKSLNSIPSKISAKSGENGKGKDQHGPNAKDLIIKIPLGTVLREIDAPKYQFLDDFEFEPGSTTKIKLKEDPSDDYAVDELLEDEEVSEESGIDRLFKIVKKEEDESKKNMFFKFYPSKVIYEQSLSLERLPEDYVDYLHHLKYQEAIEYDFSTNGEKVLICSSGIGGKGNPYFGSAANKYPYIALNGLPGQTRVLELELKTIADVGLVGMPNAGKSTFITSVSNAHPRIAPYPFTTLNPYIGTVEFDRAQKMTIADIPGIIKGAHLNKGLGHSFLKHIERSKILAYVIDLSKENPWEDLRDLKSELELYKTGLTNRPSVVIANKADLHETARPNYEKWISNTNIPIIPVSAKEAKNVKKVIAMLKKLVDSLKQ